MAETQVRFLDDLSAPIRRFTYVSPDGADLGEIVCDTSTFKGWDEIRWLRFPDEEAALLTAGKAMEARELLLALLADWVTAQNPEWTAQRLLSLLTLREAYDLCAFFTGRLRGAFQTAVATPIEKKKTSRQTAASQTPRRKRTRVA